jgi:hypothetical protein
MSYMMTAHPILLVIYLKIIVDAILLSPKN